MTESKKHKSRKWKLAEEVAFKALCLKKLTRAEIVDELNKKFPAIQYTEKMVIGKAKALRLTIYKPEIVKPVIPKQPVNIREQLAREASKQFIVPEDNYCEDKAYHETINLKPNQCRWPIGNLRSKNFCYCKNQSIAGKSYCQEHAARSVDIAETERMRRIFKNVKV